MNYLGNKFSIVKHLSFLFTLIFCISFISPASAQYYFGRNKVQYNQFNWRVLQTEHFNIFYYPEMEELANIGANYAEESYKILRVRFDQTIKNRIPLIFYSSHFHFQETNVIPNIIPEGVGGFFEYIKGRVVIPSNGSMSQFRHVIQHELVHVFTSSKINRVLKDNKKLDWNNLPLWFTEGLAEYWSQGWDSQAEMFLRDAVVNNYLFPLEHIYQISGSFLMYKEGQAVCRFIAEKYGEDKLLQIFENYWKVNNFSKVLKLTIGKDYREFDEEWTYHLKKEKYPLLKNGDIPGKVTTRLTQEGVNTMPAFAVVEDKPTMVFFSNRMGYSNIYKKPIKPYEKNKFKPKILIKGERTSKFESFHLLQSKLDVSTNGHLAFVSKSGGNDAIYIYDLHSDKIKQKLQFENLVYLSSPAWDSKGERIVFSAIDFSGKNDLYIVRLFDKHLTRLTNDIYDDRDPSWAPDAQSIVFSSDRTEYGEDGAYNLFQMNLNSYSIDYITNGNFRDYSPVWSPDGQYLAFSSDRDDAFNIWVIKTGLRYKTPPIQLADQIVNHSELEITPQTTEPYVSVIEDGTPVEFVIDKPQLKKVTHFVTGAFDPEWTQNDDLLFTAFENFSFQIRELKGVTDLFEQASFAAMDNLRKKGAFWVKKKRYQHEDASSIKYKRKYSLDLAQSYVTQDPIFGTYGGAQLAVSDLLGNQQYYFLIFNNATSKDEILKSFNVAVTRLNLSHRINLAYGLYHFAGRYYNFYDGYFYERRYGGFFGLSYPFSVFRRVEASVNFRNSEKEIFATNYYRKALLISNFVSFVKDNSLWGPTGPLDGSRYNLTVGNTVDIQHSKVNFYTFILDYRHYLRLSRRVTFATRWMGSFNIGKETIKFIMGGSWDLRGYQRWSIWGEKMALLSQELRFPFIDHLVINFPFGGVGFSSIRGALFLDNGNAWDGKFNRLLGSFGAGIRFNMGGLLVLRLDFGKKFHTNFNNSPFKPQEITIDPGTFTQFFFGWDF